MRGKCGKDRGKNGKGGKGDGNMTGNMATHAAGGGETRTATEAAEAHEGVAGPARRSALARYDVGKVPREDTRL